MTAVKQKDMRHPVFTTDHTNVKIGFTGTRDGMTFQQWKAVFELLDEHRKQITEFHHGDCVGADEEVHDIAMRLGLYIIVHPPDNDRLRAFCQGNITLEPKPYLVRERNIVESTDNVLATPATKQRVARSGTWTTTAYALETNKLWKVVYPDGIMVNG